VETSDITVSVESWCFGNSRQSRSEPRFPPWPLAFPHGFTALVWRRRTSRGFSLAMNPVFPLIKFPAPRFLKRGYGRNALQGQFCLHFPLFRRKRLRRLDKYLLKKLLNSRLTRPFV
jgi:hypothetical protein